MRTIYHSYCSQTISKYIDSMSVDTGYETSLSHLTNETDALCYKQEML